MRRLTGGLEIPLTATPTADTAVRVPDGFIPQNARVFRILNRNPCYAWLVGTSAKMDGTLPTAPTVQAGINGWLFMPYERDENPTQNPIFMSARAEDNAQYPLSGLTLLPLLIWWGE